MAPMVLLRSEQSVALGARWFLQCEEFADNNRLARRLIFGAMMAGAGLIMLKVFPLIEATSPNTSIGVFMSTAALLGLFALPILLLAFSIRFSATLAYVRTGLKMLSRNFRRLTLCTSPAQTPELVPGLDRNSAFTLDESIRDLSADLSALMGPSWSLRYLGGGHYGPYCRSPSS
jgi:hypothetical protein